MALPGGFSAEVSASTSLAGRVCMLQMALLEVEAAVSLATCGN